MSGTGESRSELLAWLNNLLQLNVQRVEECGTGAAYCQIMDSIYLDVPMHRVKFDVSQEYDYYPNYKILQSCFARHKIEKIVYVEKLVKCRFQDNLEFLQWIKKYWMQHKDSNPYDPLQRRKSTRQVSNGSLNSREQTPNIGNSLNITKRRPPQMGRINSNNGNTMGTYNNYSNGNNKSTITNNNTTRANMTSTYTNRRVSSEKLVTLQNDLTYAKEKIINLNSEIDQYKETTNILEREREFYFGKLRDIEILVQSTQDLINEGLYKNSGTDELTKFLNRVQQILYATEEAEVEYEDNHTITNQSNNIHNNHINDMNQDTISNHTANINSIGYNDDGSITNRQIINDDIQLQENDNTNHQTLPITDSSQNTINIANDNPTDNINNNLIIDEETF